MFCWETRVEPCGGKWLERSDRQPEAWTRQQSEDEGNTSHGTHSTHTGKSGENRNEEYIWKDLATLSELQKHTLKCNSKKFCKWNTKTPWPTPWLMTDPMTDLKTDPMTDLIIDPMTNPMAYMTYMTIWPTPWWAPWLTPCSGVQSIEHLNA